MKSYCKGFTPLEKNTDKVSDEYLVKGDGALMPSSAHTVREHSSLTGFTLVEVLVAAAILAFCLCGLLATYINMFFLADLSRDFTLANNAIQAKIEEIKKTNFDGLSLGESPFNLTDYGFPSPSEPGEVTSKGNITVSSTGYSDLKIVRLIACFKSRGRIIGEDSNLNGILNSGEDTNNNGRLDSPVEVITLIAK